jgi:hypothetical protein
MNMDGAVPAQSKHGSRVIRVTISTVKSKTWFKIDE